VREERRGQMKTSSSTRLAARHASDSNRAGANKSQNQKVHVRLRPYAERESSAAGRARLEE